MQGEPKQTEEEMPEEPIMSEDVFAPHYPEYIRLSIWRELATIAEEKNLPELAAPVRNLRENAGRDKRKHHIFITDADEKKRWLDGADNLIIALMSQQLGNRDQITDRVSQAAKDDPVGPGELELPVWSKEIYSDTKAEEESRKAFNRTYNGFVPPPIAKRRSILTSRMRWLYIKAISDTGDYTFVNNNPEGWLAAVRSVVPENLRPHVTWELLTKAYEILLDNKSSTAMKPEPTPTYPDYPAILRRYQASLEVDKNHDMQDNGEETANPPTHDSYEANPTADTLEDARQHSPEPSESSDQEDAEELAFQDELSRKVLRQQLAGKSLDEIMRARDPMLENE